MAIVLLIAMVVSQAAFSTAQTPSVTLHDVMIGPIGTRAAFKVSSALHVEMKATGGEETFPFLDDGSYLSRPHLFTKPSDKLTDSSRVKRD